MRGSKRARNGAASVACALMCGVAGASAAAAQAPDINGPTLPLNDVQLLLSLTGGQYDKTWGEPTKIPGPKLAPVPRATCGPDSKPLDGMQGRISADDMKLPQAADGWTCNTEVVSHYETAGGYRTWRYTDDNGHTCAFYDTSLQSPAGDVSLLAAPTQGVEVLDMSDPARPKRTALLTSPAMLSPHESLNLNAKRGLLAAEVSLDTFTSPSAMEIYDVKSDCRRPRLLSTMPIELGHESGFSPDGNTFWVASVLGRVLAVDVADPKAPRVIRKGDMYAHGVNLSDDGRTAYISDPVNTGYGILDVSEIQDRKPDPTVRQISRIVFDSGTVPQNSNPLTIKGHKYLLEYDELAMTFNPVAVNHKVGAARLIDIDDPAKPAVTSNLRLEVNMEDNHRQAANDPAPLGGPAFIYGAHYCAAPQEVDPEIVACSFWNSGLRIFDVRDPQHPRETAYFIAPPNADRAADALPGNIAVSQPSFDIARHDVWYSDGVDGFYVLHLNDAAWPTTPLVAGRTAAGDRRLKLAFFGRRRAERGVLIKAAAAGGALRDVTIELRRGTTRIAASRPLKLTRTARSVVLRPAAGRRLAPGTYVLLAKDRRGVLLRRAVRLGGQGEDERRR